MSVLVPAILQHERADAQQVRDIRDRRRFPHLLAVELRHRSWSDDVAGTLELSMSQVKVYLHRARKQLREQLAPLRA